MANSLMPFGSGSSDPFLTLHREMNRLFDDVLRSSPSRQFQDRSAVPISMDVSETDKEYKITVELPGVKEEDVDVTLQDDMLIIRGEKKSETERGGEKENYYYAERSYGSFQRSLRLPLVAKPEDVKAQFRDGVLTISLPKTGEQNRSHRIQIAHGGGQPETKARGGSDGNPKDKATTESPKQ